MADYRVNVLSPGYVRPLSDTTFRADGTVTLIAGANNIVVDTGGPQDKQAILDSLHKYRIRPEDVAYVVCTHGHSDHTGNNNLFPEATMVFGNDISKGDMYRTHDFAAAPFAIDEQVQIVATPGHTTEDVSVLVRSGGIVTAVVGDLFESEFDEGIWQKMSQFPEEQQKNREMILSLADVIIPGHGNAFRNQK